MNERSPVTTSGTASVPATAAECRAGETPHVEPFHDDDPGVGAEGCRELVVADIHRDHGVGAALAQDQVKPPVEAPMSSATRPAESTSNASSAATLACAPHG